MQEIWQTLLEVIGKRYYIGSLTKYLILQAKYVLIHVDSFDGIFINIDGVYLFFFVDVFREYGGEYAWSSSDVYDAAELFDDVCFVCQIRVEEIVHSIVGRRPYLC